MKIFSLQHNTHNNDLHKKIQTIKTSTIYLILSQLPISVTLLYLSNKNILIFHYGEHAGIMLNFWTLRSFFQFPMAIMIVLFTYISLHAFYEYFTKTIIYDNGRIVFNENNLFYNKTIIIPLEEISTIHFINHPLWAFLDIGTIMIIFNNKKYFIEDIGNISNQIDYFSFIIDGNKLKSAMPIDRKKCRIFVLLFSIAIVTLCVFIGFYIGYCREMAVVPTYSPNRNLTESQGGKE